MVANNIIFGYARVSTKNQSVDAQISELEKNGCNKIFIDIASTRRKLPELEKLIEILRTGDTLIVWKLDRLGRSITSLITTLNTLIEKGVKLVSITQDIDTSTTQGKVFVCFLAMFAEIERDYISERTKKGLEAARKRGVKGGRPQKLDAKKIEKLKRMYESKEFPVKEILNIFEISKQTLYNIIDKK